MINLLDKEDWSMISKLVDEVLTAKKFKDFFNKNLAAIYTQNPPQSAVGFVYNALYYFIA